MPSAGGLVLEQGRVIAKKYVLDRPAGFGGMAQLWVATNESTGAEVCIKLLVPDLGSDPSAGGHDEELVERFHREAHAAARLSHRAIVRVFDLLELDENGDAIPRGSERAAHAYGIVMELLHGETLGDMLAKRGKLPLEEALDLFLPIVSALAHAHRADVIHRDLKPDNIFLAEEPDGHVIPKVLDFGVSKLVSASGITIDGVLVGTPAFMSPEQAKGSRQVDARSDVFSAGILFYMMLSGRNPFEDAPTFASVVDAVLRREVSPLPDVPAPIWEVIARAIAKDPAQRFEGASEMSIALRKAAGRKTQTESDASIPLPAPSSSRSVATSTRPEPRTSVEPAAVEAGGEGAAPDAARLRMRAIVAAVVGAAAAIVVVAGALSLLGSKPDAEPNASPRTAARQAPSAATPGTAAPAGERPPATAATTSAHAEPPPAAPERSASASTQPAAPTRPAVAPVGAPAAPAHGAAAPKRAPAAPVRAPAPTSTRRPGEEPHKARDPGF